MNTDRKKQIRRTSMQGTFLFALGLIAAIAFIVAGSLWLVGAAVVFFVLGIILLYRVGNSLG